MTEPSGALRQHYDLCGARHDYPAWSGPPRRSVLVCTHPRSGSTMLGEALYFAGGLGCPLEYHHAGFRPGFEARWGVVGLRALTSQVWRYRTNPSGTVAAKLFWRDVADLAEELAPGALPCLRTVPADEVSPAAYRRLGELLGELFPGAVHVHLERRDRLRQAVSGVVAVRTGVWRRIASVEDGPAADVMDHDVAEIGRLIASSAFCHAHWQAFFRANGIDAHAIAYEELVADYRGTVERLLRALGHPGAAPAVRMERQSTAASEALMRRFLRDQRAALRR